VTALGDRWARYLDGADRELLRGDTLVHADPNPHNLIVDDVGDVHLIDWAMACVGPAWADVACTYLHLLHAGQTPAMAHAWAAGVPAWREADPAAVGAFVRGLSGEWVDAVGEAEARRGVAEFESLTESRVPTPHRPPR
jgi:Ser/Thr protein kinase RdoA (MazF antagonist)